MTATALKVKSTPIGPYIDLLESMTREEKQIVVTFITESIEESAVEAKSNAEIIREKLKGLTISPEIARLRGCMKLTESEKQDERTQYILGL